MHARLPAVRSVPHWAQPRARRSHGITRASHRQAKAACATLLSIALPLARPAAAEPPPMEEIVVTSQLRATGLAELPTSITLLDAETLEAASLQHFEELTLLVPNLNWSGEGTRARYFQLRGVGELEQYEGAPNPSVGFLVDDIDFSAIGGIATLFDVDRVEVLRGPQGTRYGANALGGLVYVRSAGPTDTPEARIEASGGDDGTLALGLAAGGPVPGAGGQLGYRLALQQYASDGFRDNVYLGRDDTNERDELTARGKLRWQPSDDFRAELTGLYVDLDNGYDAFAIDNGLTTYADQPGRDAQQTVAAAARLELDLATAARLVSLTSWARSDIDFGFDADWGNEEFWAPYGYDFTQAFDRERRTWSQELRLLSGPDGRLAGRLDWVLGLYALGLDETNRRVDQGRYDDGSFCTPCLLDVTADSDYAADSFAVFGEASWPLDERTTLAAGLRWERRAADYADTGGNDFAPTDRMLGGELSLTRELAPGLSAYARIARGYKAGGFNLGFAGLDFDDLELNVGPEQIEYDPEYLWNYELGLRGDGARWTGELTLFWQDREDLQIRIPVQLRAGDPTTFLFFTDNAEAGTSYGLEASGELALSDWLTLHASLGLLETEVDRFSADPGLAGRALAHAPRYQYHLGATLGSPGGWFARLDLGGRDRFYFDYGHDQRSDAYALVDLRTGWAGERWRVELWARNLFDEAYAVRGFFFGNEPPDFPEKLYVRLGDPRHVGLTVSWRLAAAP